MEAQGQGYTPTLRPTTLASVAKPPHADFGREVEIEPRASEGLTGFAVSVQNWVAQHGIRFRTRKWVSQANRDHCSESSALLDQTTPPEPTTVAITPTPWLSQPMKLRFQLGEIVLGTLTFPALVPEDHFTRWIGGGPEPDFPFERFPDGVEVVKFPSYPIPEPLPVLSVRARSILYVPAQYQHSLVETRGTTFETYLKKFSSKSRSTLRKKVRRFAEHCGNAHPCREFQRPEEMAEFHRLARTVSAKTYQERLLRSGLPDTEEFRQRLERDAARDQVRGYILFDGARPVAYLHSPAQGRHLLYEHVGHDPEYDAFSPGTVLLYHVIERLFNAGRFQSLDFTEGEGEHKEFFGTRSLLCADLYYFRRSGGNRLLLGCHQGLRNASRAGVVLLDRLGLKARVKKLLRSRS